MPKNPSQTPSQNNTSTPKSKEKEHKGNFILAKYTKGTHIFIIVVVMKSSLHFAIHFAIHCCLSHAGNGKKDDSTSDPTSSEDKKPTPTKASVADTVDPSTNKGTLKCLSSLP